MAQAGAAKRDRHKTIPNTAHVKEHDADVAKPAGSAKVRGRRPGFGKPFLTAATLRESERMLTQAVSSVADAPAEAPSVHGKDGATDGFARMYSLIVHAVPEELRLHLVERMKEGLSNVEREVRAELPDADTRKSGKRVSTADFVAQLEQDEREYREEQVASKELLSNAEMRARLQVTPQALSAAVKAKRMFTLPGPSGAQFFPAFFADRAYDRPVLERVCKALGDLPGARKYFFFTAQRYSLGGKSPLQALAKGKIDQVLAAAEAYLEE